MATKKKVTKKKVTKPSISDDTLLEIKVDAGTVLTKPYGKCSDFEKAIGKPV